MDWSAACSNVSFALVDESSAIGGGLSDVGLSVGDNVDEFNVGDIDDDIHGWVVELVEDNTDDL